MGELNIMSTVCLWFAGGVLGITFIVCVNKMLKQDRIRAQEKEEITAPNYKCACNFCSARVDKLGELCRECDSFGCRGDYDAQ
jgi:hypothetical protein